MDIREATGIIIRRGSGFLVGRVLYSAELRWSSSPFDAWFTRDRDTAESLARAVGGAMWLFNRVCGQLREMKERRVDRDAKSDDAGSDLRHGQPENREDPV